MYLSTFGVTYLGGSPKSSFAKLTHSTRYSLMVRRSCHCENYGISVVILEMQPASTAQLEMDAPLEINGRFLMLR
jgi:hypothetical protein